MYGVYASNLKQTHPNMSIHLHIHIHSSIFFAVPKYAPGGKAVMHMETLTEIALERCDTARCAVQTMGDLAMQYGFYGPSWNENIEVCVGHASALYGLLYHTHITDQSYNLFIHYLAIHYTRYPTPSSFTIELKPCAKYKYYYSACTIHHSRFVFY
ncbi:hypothetical protein EON63_02375 [archaeon]|nr:MAG: hypothetical protein EON63_02375 [archaeon]